MNAIPEDLLQAVSRSELNVLVGAGVSVDAGLPNWRELLTQLMGCLSDVESRRAVQRLITSERLLDAAEILRQEVSSARITQQLREILDNITDPSPIADAIWHLQPAFVMTTNYDALLETSYARKFGKSARIAVSGADAPGRLVDPRNVIGKLHGDLSLPDSIVLSRGDYYRSSLFMTRDSTGILAEFVRRPTLAIGYSLADPDLRLLLHWLEARLQGLVNAFFILIPTLPVEERRLLATLPGVVPIEYSASAGHRASLLALLKTLASAQARTRRSTSPLEMHGLLLKTLHQQLGVLLHEAHQPLAAMSANVEVMLRRSPPPEIAGLVTNLNRDMTRLVGVIRMMRDALQAGNGHLSPSTWEECHGAIQSDLARPEYQFVRSAIASATQAEIPVSAPLYCVLARVLVDNAHEASDKDQEVHIEAKFVKARGRLFLDTIVRDHGTGIPREIAASLFMPNTSSKGKGRGLGLYLLKGLVEEVGGSLELSSSSGKGTLASFKLPVTLASIIPAAAKSRRISSESKTLRGTNIVVLDDHPPVVEALARVLEQRGAKVMCFGMSRDAIKAIRARKNPPHCIVCDVVMPEMSGIEFARAVRERFPDVPILFFTGYMYTSEHIQATQLGLGHGVATLEKSSDPQQIVDAILELSGRQA